MDKAHNWWTRPCGGIDVLRQAIPLIISCGSIALMNFTDRMFLSRLQDDSMTASMQGGMLYWTTIAIPAAAAGLVTTFVAQYHGSGNDQRIGRIVWQGIWFGFFMMPILLLLFEPITSLLHYFKHDEKLIALESTYYHYMLFASAASIAGESAASFFRGLGKMRIELYNNIFCVMLNIFLDYCMIFGACGFPAWGLAGAAIATAISLWVRFFIYVTLIFLHDRKAHKFHILGGMCLDFPLMGRLCYYGIPSGLYAFIDTLTFTAFILMIGGLGHVQRDATTIAFTLNSFTFIPLNGIGIVVTSMVGNQLGKNRPDLARRATMTAQIIGCVYGGLFVFAYLFFPNFFLSIFGSGSNSAEFAEVHQLGVILLRFIALYLFFDSVTIIFHSALRGAGDTIFIAWATCLMSPLLPMACWIGIFKFDLGVLWCWTALTLSILMFCVCFAIRYRGKTWESIRVIEKEFI
jgi:MATE family multidrug resistance protein